MRNAGPAARFAAARHPSPRTPAHPLSHPAPFSDPGAALATADPSDLGGREWVVEALGCDPAALADPAALRALFARMVRELSLTPVGEALWHQFPGAGGVTGLYLLAESHLTVHTWPEHGSLCLNLFCCRPRPEWDFGAGLRAAVGARQVEVRILDRPYVPTPPGAIPV